MLMMFGAALRNAPYERAFPFNETDLMILFDSEYGLRLCNICTEDGERFLLMDFMKDKPDIFGENPEKRLEQFIEIFSSRVERFFVTHKNDYIYFDLEEQRFLKKLMSKGGLCCSVEIYKYSQDEPAQLVELEDLPYSTALQICRFLNHFKVRKIIDPMRYYNLRREQKIHPNWEGADWGSRFKEKQKSEIKKYFEKYPKLSGLDTTARVDKYFKLLLKKYHPDNNQNDASLNDLFTEINADYEAIKLTTWYRGLKGGEK